MEDILALVPEGKTVRGSGFQLTAASGDYLRIAPKPFYDGLTYTIISYLPLRTGVKETLWSHSSKAGSSGSNTGQIRAAVNRLADDTVELYLQKDGVDAAPVIVTGASILQNKINLLIIRTEANATLSCSVNGGAFTSIAFPSAVSVLDGAGIVMLGGLAAAAANSAGGTVVSTASSNFCQGVIDEIGLYSGANTAEYTLTDELIAELWNRGTPRHLHKWRFYSKLRSHHPLDFSSVKSVKAGDLTSMLVLAESYHAEYENKAHLWLDQYNDVAVGAHGTNGFDATDFRNINDGTFFCIMDVDSYSYLSSATVLLDLVTSGSDFFRVAFGAFTSSFTNEVISFLRSSGGTARALTSQTEAISGPNLLIYTIAAGVHTFWLNGISKTLTVNGTVTSFTGAITTISLGASYTNQFYMGGGLKEIGFMRRALTATEAGELSTYLMGGGERPNMASTVSVKDHALYNDAAMIELYTGAWENNALLASKKATHNLTISGRTLTNSGTSTSGGFKNRRGNVFY